MRKKKVEAPRRSTPARRATRVQCLNRAENPRLWEWWRAAMHSRQVGWVSQPHNNTTRRYALYTGVRGWISRAVPDSKHAQDRLRFHGSLWFLRQDPASTPVSDILRDIDHLFGTRVFANHREPVEFPL